MTLSRDDVALQSGVFSNFEYISEQNSIFAIQELSFQKFYGNNRAAGEKIVKLLLACVAGGISLVL